ncbi:MAG TPA: glycosyltransferase [Acidobacteriota bacterium]|nr:glycosyltransferase [Acidobacteriota bacterium]
MNSNRYVNEKEWRVLALRRSGHHAVIHWMISQCQGPGLFLNDCRLLADGRLLGNRFSRYFNFAPREAERDLCGVDLAAKELYLYNFEDLTPGQFLESTAQARPRGTSRETLDVVVIRDPFNWAASRRQAEPQLDLEAAGLLECWKLQAREARRRRNEQGFLAIYFSRWVAQRSYRRDLCQKLGLPFSDAGFREVELPGISSFDAARVARDNRVVLERWKERVWDEDYRRWMQDEELLDLAGDTGAQDALRRFRHAARPAVSVVVPTYNRAHLIGETIESVSSQSRPDWELLIVDDGSDDGTADVVRGFADPRIRYLPLQATRSMSLPRNKGLSCARGRYIALMDSDDLWEPRKLEVQIEALKRHPRAEWSWTGYATFNRGGVLKRNRYSQLESGPRQSGELTSGVRDEFVGQVVHELLETRFVIYTTTVLLTRSLLQRVGLFNEKLPWGDFDYFVRLAEHSPAVVVKDELARIRKHDGNTAGTSPLGFEEAIFSLRAAYGRGMLERPRFRRALLRLRRNFGASLIRQGQGWKGRKELAAAFLLRPSLATLRDFWHPGPDRLS